MLTAWRRVGLDGRRSQQKLSQSDKSGQLSKGTCWPEVGLQDHVGAAGGGRVVQWGAELHCFE